MPKRTIDYSKRKHYDQTTGELVDTYPDGLTAQQYYRRNLPYAPKTLGEALVLIRNLRAENKRLRTRLKDAGLFVVGQQNNGHMPPE
jgi:hypothetical protein